MERPLRKIRPLVKPATPSNSNKNRDKGMEPRKNIFDFFRETGEKIKDEFFPSKKLRRNNKHQSKMVKILTLRNYVQVLPRSF